MKLPEPLLRGTLLRRYKRFFADVLLEDGREITAVTPNTGSMKGVCIVGARVLISQSDAPTRKIPYTWELVEIAGKWVGINTHMPNQIVAEALEQKALPGLEQYDTFRREFKLPSGSRIDFMLGDEDALLEVKNVTLVENGVALFPDSVTERGTRHLHELMEFVQEGREACMVYVVQHHLATSFSPADGIDPVYGTTLRDAFQAGVKLIAMKADVTEQEIKLTESLPVEL
ncbi:MAG: DNA/RNA nuclease SfsA [Calditrichaeota bacterium]|nr:DNA/RNA nuclease SfsA [Calditrichota bacterium]MCB9391539.1 DNA/RNA nuclease SfsA [Calditrichota bacterium]